MSHLLALTGGAVVFLWGISHLIPTRRVVAGFGEIGLDHRRVITMEWVAEGLSMLFVGVLVALAAALSTGEALIYPAAAGLLVILGAWTAMTAARTPVIWFKVCPVVMAVGAGLLLAARMV